MIATPVVVVSNSTNPSRVRRRHDRPLLELVATPGTRAGTPLPMKAPATLPDVVDPTSETVSDQIAGV